VFADASDYSQLSTGDPPVATGATLFESRQATRGDDDFFARKAPEGFRADLPAGRFPLSAVSVTRGQRMGDFVEEGVSHLFDVVKHRQFPGQGDGEFRNGARPKPSRRSVERETPMLQAVLVHQRSRESSCLIEIHSPKNCKLIDMWQEHRRSTKGDLLRWVNACQPVRTVLHVLQVDGPDRVARRGEKKARLYGRFCKTQARHMRR